MTDDLIGGMDDSLSPQVAAAQLKAEQQQAGAGRFWIVFPTGSESDFG
ncbi:MAG: hypothetical protein JW862_02450 [Anaerolineales bacterium]|nr:hypothetical protein [Anaerolineales bacterium]